MGAWAVYVFFTLSGYWICIMWKSKYSLCRYPYAVFIISRYWRLLPLFLVCTLIAEWSCYLSPRCWDGNATSLFDPHWWLRTLLIAGSTKQPMLLGPAWSIDVEMEYYFLAPMVVAGGIMTRRLKGQLNAVLYLVLICGLLTIYSITGFNFAKYLTLFLAGMLFSVISWKPSLRAALITLATTLGLFCVLIVVYESRTLPFFSPEVNSVPLQHWIFYVMALGFLPYSMHTVHLKSSQLDRNLGDLAYSVYLFHWIPVKILGVTMSQYPEYMVTGLILAVTMAGSLLLYVCVDNPMEKLRHRYVKYFVKK